MLCKLPTGNLTLKLQYDEGTYTDSEVDTGMNFCSDAESKFTMGIYNSNTLLFNGRLCTLKHVVGFTVAK